MKVKTISASENQFGISFLRVISTISVIIKHVSGPLVVKNGELSDSIGMMRMLLVVLAGILY